MREEVGGTTTGGEQAWGSVGDGWAIFFDVAGCDGCQEGSIGWIDGIGTSNDASRCWEEDAKVWGEYVGCIGQVMRVYRFGQGVSPWF
jgi:hypothetical protein